MKDLYSGLSPAEIERLTLLTEEMGEAIQIVGKIIRHGYESVNPLLENSRTNRAMLEKELGDVRHAILRLCEAGDLSKEAINFHADEKRKSVAQWLHHQPKDEEAVW